MSSDLLEYYALAQQSVHGNNNTIRPSTSFLFIFNSDKQGAEKWDAWRALQNKLTPNEAKRKFLLKLAKYAAMPGASIEVVQWIKNFATKIATLHSTVSQANLFPAELLDYDTNNEAPISFVPAPPSFYMDSPAKEILTLGELRARCTNVEHTLTQEIKLLKHSLREGMKRLADLEHGIKIQDSDDVLFTFECYIYV